MINTKSLQAVKESTFSKSFIKPLYSSYCFSNIPPTIANLLTGEDRPALPRDVLSSTTKQVEKVVLLLVDGFGWQFVDRFTPKYPFLQRLKEQGVLSKLTTQFPSTTPAELTTLYTGQPVGEHGVYEWFYYEPKLDALMSPLLFSFAGKKVPNTLVPTGIRPEELFPSSNFAEYLAERNVATYTFRNADYLGAPYDSVMFRGATNYGFSSLDEGCKKLAGALLGNPGKGYYHMYYDKIDQACHKYGPDSVEFEEAVDLFCTTMEEAFIQPVAGKLDKTVFMMTADHGQVAIEPEKTIYLNKEYPQCEKWMQTNKRGELLVPAGACRDLFLHIKDEHLDEAEQFFKEKLSDFCEMYRVEYLITEGFFGANVSDTFRSRVGNLVLLCTSSVPVWWYEQDRFEVVYRGHHGGLTRPEAETFLACLPFEK